MMINFENNRLLLDFPNKLGQLEILDLTAFVADKSKATFYFKGPNLVSQKADRVLVFSLPLDIEPVYFKKYLTAQKTPQASNKRCQNLSGAAFTLSR
jgi:hypothetical protein